MNLVDTLLAISIFTLLSSDPRWLVGCTCQDSITHRLDGLKTILEFYSFT